MAEPSKKSEEVEMVFEDIFGFERRDAIRGNRCQPKPIGCEGPAVEFNGALSEKEYTISGLCQACQDAVWAAYDDEEDWENE